jgi:hypothetical protein
MRAHQHGLALLTAIASLLAGCSLLPVAQETPAGPTPMPIPTATPLPAAQLTFNLTPPSDTPANAEVALILVDEVTGFPYNTTAIPMQRLTDGRWSAETTAPAGALLRYRYARGEPEPADEVSATGEAILYRVARITGPGVIEDIVAAWADAPYHGPTGRIAGHLRNSQSGEPLPEVIVTAGGVQTFTDGEGYFRIDGVPPGLQRVTAFSPDGAYYSADQGALVAAGSATPVELGLLPAPAVQVGFEVTVPSNTSPGPPMRIAGNLLQLGHLFTSLPGGTSISSARAPVLTQLDPSHFIFVATLYAGTDLRYKYTLGDGLWNAERSADGAFVTRRVILPAENIILEDAVSTWRGGGSAVVSLRVSTPANTPPGDLVAIQFNPFTWFEPIPMLRLGPNEWFFALHGPLEAAGHLGYRYCRDYACGSADDAETADPSTTGRPLAPSLALQDIRDTVTAWQWWEGEAAPTTVVAPDIAPLPGFEAGVEVLPRYRPTWPSLFTQEMSEVASGGANGVVLTPAWILGDNAPLPSIAFDPARSPFRSDLRQMIGQALAAGLEVSIRPSLVPASGDLGAWWRTAPRDQAWWDSWFEGYRSLALTYARYAAENGASRLILGGPEAIYAMPGSTFPDGSSTSVPADAEARWRSLLGDVRQTYRGRLAFEIDYNGAAPLLPPFLDAVDEVYVYWHVPLADGPDASLATMQLSAGRALDALLSNQGLQGLPIILSVEYLSINGSAMACAPFPDGSCRPPESFDLGAVVDPDLTVDLEEQAQAFNAVIAEAYGRPEIEGFYARRYNPEAALRDLSASVNGKPARDVLWYWFGRITGGP